MTLYLNFRSAAVGGSIVQRPYVISGAALGKVQPAMTSLTDAEFRRLIRGRRVVIATHGFNVSYANGLRSLATLEDRLALPSDQLFVGLVWPGDFWLPVVNYPAEAGDAVRVGRLLARYLNAEAGEAAGFAFVSHSLGARVILEAVKGLTRPADLLVLTASAVDDDVLSRQYDAARRNAEAVAVLASRGDKVLRLAYPAGDFLSDVLYDDDSPFAAALGREGSRPRRVDRVSNHQIPDAAEHDHGHYLPPGDGGTTGAKWPKAVGFVARALKGQRQTWPLP